MLQHKSRSSEINDKKIYDILIKVGSLFNERKTKQTLISEMLKASRDIEFNENKLDSNRITLQKINNEIKDIEARLFHFNSKGSILKKEQEEIYAKHSMVQKIEQDLEKKQKLLPKIEAEILTLEEQLYNSQNKLNIIKPKQNEVLNKKNKLAKRNSDLIEKIESLNVEIPIIKNTYDVLIGDRQENINENDYSLLKGDFENNLKDYFLEINQEIEKTNINIAELKHNIEHNKKYEKGLLIEKSLLTENIKKITAEIGIHHEKEQIISTVNNLRKQNKYFIENIDITINDITKIQSEIKKNDKKFKHKQHINNVLKNKYNYFITIKQQMNRIEDIEAEIKRLLENIDGLSLETNIDNNLNEIVTKINMELSEL